MSAMDWSERAACRDLDGDIFFPLGEDEVWQDRALCAEVDGELFFPEQGGSVREAKLICRRCVVKQECGEYALEHDLRFGVWGGLSERERRDLRRSNREARHAA